MRQNRLKAFRHLWFQLTFGVAPVILFAEDDPVQARAFTAAFKEIGLMEQTLITVKNGAEAIAYLKRSAISDSGAQKPDLLDYGLANANGGWA